MPENNAQATPQELNRFVQTVDEFMANYARLISPDTRAKVYATGNPALIGDYDSAVSQGRILKRTIETTVGAWNTAKAAWQSVTGATSTAIGDAIDEIRSWFGYEPAGGVGAYENHAPIHWYDSSPISGGTLGYLGVVQLPAAAWIAGIVSAAYLLNQTMNKIFISMEAARIMQADPTVSRSQALSVASKAIKTPGILGAATLPLIAAAALAAFLIFGKKR